MNVVKLPWYHPWLGVGAIVFAVASIVIALTDCRPSLPDEPPFTVVDSGDAAALLDVGPHPTACARACANFAAQSCREARGICVDRCEAGKAIGSFDDLALGCVAAAHDRKAIQRCGDFCR